MDKIDRSEPKKSGLIIKSQIDSGQRGTNNISWTYRDQSFSSKIDLLQKTLDENAIRASFVFWHFEEKFFSIKLKNGGTILKMISNKNQKNFWWEIETTSWMIMQSANI